ncbi:putative glycerol kinase 5 [Oppia nitens]|uniref:putative glycerol kinase 5 n=1 Tax=Oppia nitens TaxID=1686743 RepID=UPI0023DC412E|nr:putative glycerol kinase 5 [Oppia nitens]XP_054153023.1 putative glycerol kinase 5 [Oppia nitens]
MSQANGNNDRTFGGETDCDKYILVVDVGTTNIRGHIYDQRARLIGEAVTSVQLIHPHLGYEEISAQTIWDAFLDVIKRAIDSAKISVHQVLCIGISTMRGTFITWDKETGEPFHNFITWKDIRSNQLCDQWNESLRMKCLKMGAKFIHFFTRSSRFLAASLLKFTTGMVVMRLVWVLHNIPEVRHQAIEGKALYGTIDTYLIWKLTSGKVHATDPSNACVTGFYDPFLMKWGDWALNMLNIPPSMLPLVKDTNGDYGRTNSQLFGASIPIRAIVGDQQAAMFGECCFREGDFKCTLGTGTFININTGEKPCASYKGLYPIVGWKLKNEEKPIYLMEGASYDTGTAIKWAHNIGLFDDLKKTSDMAKNVSNDDLYFVPAFSGLQAPINDNFATSAFIGINSTTSKAQMIRSILESLCFRVKQMYEIVLEEQPDLLVKQFRIDGGVSANDFVVQMIADLTGKKVERAVHQEMSSLGAAFLAGLAVGYWTSSKHISSLRGSDKVFIPQRNTWNNSNRNKFESWERAINRCLNWHQ